MGYMRLLVGLFLSFFAAAQTPLQLRHETSLIFQKSAGVAAVSDPFALLSNPAGLVQIPSFQWSGGYLYNISLPSHHIQTVMAGSLIPGLALGLGVNYKPGGIGTTLGLAVGDPKTFSLGVSAYKQRVFTRPSAEPFLWDVGFQLRPTPWLSGGFVIAQNRAVFGSGFDLTLGLTFRPFSASGFVFGVDTALVPIDPTRLDSQFVIEPAFKIAGDLGPIGLHGFIQLKEVHADPKPFFGIGIHVPLDAFTLSPLYASVPFESSFVGGAFHYNPDQPKSLIKKTDQWVWLNLEAGGFPKNPNQSIQEMFLNPLVHPLIYLNQVSHLANREDIRGILMVLNNTGLSLEEALNWKEAIERLKQAGKKVVFLLNSSEPADYLLASFGDKVYLDPVHSLNLDFFRGQLVHAGDVLKKIGIEAEAVAAGAYKTAPRLFTANASSDQEREVLQGILKTQKSVFEKHLIENRKMTAEKVASLIDSNWLSPKEALDHQLVDGLLYKNDFLSQVEKDFQMRVSLLANPFKMPSVSWGLAQQIAVIPIEGMIIEGRTQRGFINSGNSQVGSDDVIELLEQAIKHPQTAGILIYMNSPGGSAEGSYAVQEAIKRYKQKKPIYVCMSQMGASGGYEIASAASWIFAQPSTLTGSIGVFSLFFSGGELSKKVGLHHEEVRLGQNPGSTLLRPLSLTERKRMQENINWHYENFKNVVKEHRDLSQQEIDQAAEGRVWTGEEALQKRLVDQLGGFLSAYDTLKAELNLGDAFVGIQVLGNAGIPMITKEMAFGLTSLAAFWPHFNQRTLALSPLFWLSYQHKE